MDDRAPANVFPFKKLLLQEALCSFFFHVVFAAQKQASKHVWDTVLSIGATLDSTYITSLPSSLN